jgi:hypothetical protein
MINKIYPRLILYLLIFQVYLIFMSINSPLGVDWLDWHFQRIFNFSEYLIKNGLFSNYGFSIWSKCIDCVLNQENWSEKIYLSTNFFSNLPYIFFNKFFGEMGLKVYGQYFDKLIIFSTGILIAELFLNFSTDNKINYNNIANSQLIFIFFVINPWTYKMLISQWVFIYTIIFFLFGIFMFMKNRYFFGIFFFFLAGCFDYQSSAGLFVFYSAILIYSKIKKNNSYYSILFQNIKKNRRNAINLLISLFLPVVIFFILKIIALEDLNYASSGSSLLRRIGISGDDMHNGGILGALQFFGGNRITICFSNLSSNLNTMNLDIKIYIFNCSLSILSMFVLSLLSLIGLFIFYKKEKKFFNIVIFPIAFLLISYTFILQQSSSVHLMGYSYFFSILFAYGISNLITHFLKKFEYSLISLCFALPIILGFVILCLRVNMLTGSNG